MAYYNLKGYNKDMFLGAMVTWWYTKGIQRRLDLILSHLMSTVDFFSIRLLVSTWLSPYKQISASYALPDNFIDQLKNMVDKLISRSIGAVVRTFMIAIGLVVLVLQFIFEIMIFSIWLLLPILPIIFLILFVSGRSLKWMI